MSSRNSPTLTLEINGRRSETRAAWLVLGCAACAVALLGALPFWMQGLAGAALGAIWLGLWRAGWIGSRYRIVAVRWSADGRWALAERHRSAIPAELSGATRLAGPVVWLHWKTAPGRRRSMLLARGDMPAGQLRTLRARLRIEALERALPDIPTR
jgi:toxin CptA